MSEMYLAHLRKMIASLIAMAIALGPSITPVFAASNKVQPKAVAAATATPIQHLVVIFQENVSFDHYFGTYPNALNLAGEPRFKAAANTPNVNGLTNALLTFNPNLNPLNLGGASNPFRLDRSQAVTPDQDHNYLAEQQAFDAGLMDLFPHSTGVGGTAGSEVMGYYDGNTVTAEWNYAQHFAMSDNSFGTTFGPSSPGVVNLISGQTNGVVATLNGTGDEVNGGSDGSLTLINDADPLGDVCSNPTRNQATMGTKNIGDLLTSAGVTWGSFMGGFNLSIVNANGTTGCTPQFRRSGWHHSRLHPAPLVLQLLHFDRQLRAHAAEFNRRDRKRRSREPPIRPAGFLYRRRPPATCPP